MLIIELTRVFLMIRKRIDTSNTIIIIIFKIYFQVVQFNSSHEKKAQKVATEINKSAELIHFFLFFFFKHVLLVLYMNLVSAFITIRSSSSSSPSRRHFRLRQPYIPDAIIIIKNNRASLASLSFSFPFTSPFTFRSSFPKRYNDHARPVITHATFIMTNQPSNNRSKRHEQFSHLEFHPS